MNVKEMKKKSKKIWGKFWFILWKDDSFKGWLFSVIFLFLFIKLIFFPSLSLITGTSLPLAIVESCSMYHQGNILSDFDSWWERHENKYEELNIEKNEFRDFIFNDGFNKGDILFVVGANPDNLEIGDVIIFSRNSGNPVIHRVIDIKEENGERIFSTIGDNNNGQLSFEKEISENQLMGKAVFKLAPYAGWIKLIFYEGVKPSSGRGFCDER